MEYPTLITTGGGRLENLFARATEALTLHELGHQWFYGMVASNEHDSPVLDEGLASFAEATLMDDWFGNASGGQLGPLSIHQGAARRIWSSEGGRKTPLAQPAPDFPDFAAIGASVYARTTTLTQSLKASEPLLHPGAATENPFDAMLARYARDYRFRHPTVADLLRVVEAELGANAAVNLRRALYDKATVDFEFAQLSSESTPSGYRTQATVKRHGELEIPVVVRFFDDRGTAIDRVWLANEAETVLELQSEHAIVSAVIDPEIRVPLDDDLLNNSINQAQNPPFRALLNSVYYN
jgi:aminopeptidase N